MALAVASGPLALASRYGFGLSLGLEGPGLDLKVCCLDYIAGIYRENWTAHTTVCSRRRSSVSIYETCTAAPLRFTSTPYTGNTPYGQSTASRFFSATAARFTSRLMYSLHNFLPASHASTFSYNFLTSPFCLPRWRCW